MNFLKTTFTCLFASLLGLVNLSVSVWAAEDVKIGLVYPLSGNSANAGKSSIAACEVAAQLINEHTSGFEALPLAVGKGIPSLGGAKIKLIPADTQGNPSEGQAQTLRLITQEKVVGLVGAYQSSVAITTTAVAERYAIPMLIGDSVAANITERGFQWTFRTTPIARDFAQSYMEFMEELKKANHPINSIAIVYENTDYGVSVSGTVRTVAKAHGFNIVADLAYNANGADVSAQVLQLKDKKPDAIIFISYTSDAILYAKTMKSLDYFPPLMIGDDSGFSDSAFIASAGNLAQGIIDRSGWALGAKDSINWRINELFKAKTGRDIDDTSARTMQAFFVLVDAINRAGSTKPEAIQAALRATDMKPEHMIMGYKGVKFDEKGQNMLAATYLTQLFGDQYFTVWPTKGAERKLVYPYKAWK